MARSQAAKGLPVHPVHHLLTTGSSSVRRTSSFSEKAWAHLVPDGSIHQPSNQTCCKRLVQEWGRIGHDDHTFNGLWFKDIKSSNHEIFHTHA